LERGLYNSQLNWETDPKDIVKVVFKLAGKGRRAFFFHYLGGYYNEASRTFKWGHHPQGHH